MPLNPIQQWTKEVTQGGYNEDEQCNQDFCVKYWYTVFYVNCVSMNIQLLPRPDDENSWNEDDWDSATHFNISINGIITPYGIVKNLSLKEAQNFAVEKILPLYLDQIKEQISKIVAAG